MYNFQQGGNSGSPVVHEETGEAIGVHTHGGCSATGGSNKGTRIDVPAFKLAVDTLLGTPPPPPTPPPTSAPCSQGHSRISVDILTDNYPSETTFTLEDECSGGVVLSGGPYSSTGTLFTDETACLPDSQYTFTINDSYGDGEYLWYMGVIFDESKPFHPILLNFLLN